MSNNNSNLTQNLNALSANWVQINFANTKIGYLQDFSGQNDYGLQPLSGIGDAHVVEYVPGLATHTLTATRALIRTASLFSLIGPQDQFTNMDGILQGYTFDVLLMQQSGTSGTAKNLRVWHNCSIGADSIQVTKQQIILNNVTLHALDVSDNLVGANGVAVNNMDTSS